jgi:hypothetical protein
MALSHPQFGLGAGAHQEVPFCAAVTRARAVVLLLCSALDQVRLAGTHSTGCRARLRAPSSWGSGPRCSRSILRPQRHVGDTR